MKPARFGDSLSSFWPYDRTNPLLRKYGWGPIYEDVAVAVFPEGLLLSEADGDAIFPFRETVGFRNDTMEWHR